MNSSSVDLRSDAVTLPSPAMRQAMAQAAVGDDDFGEDPTILALEREMALRLDKEAALFVLSGTMGNVLAVLAQAEPGQAVAAGQNSHIFDHEYPGMQRLAGVNLRPVPDTTALGRLAWDEASLRQMLAEPAHSRPALVCFEQTNNRLGGVVMPLKSYASLASMARDSGVKVHLDGARLFNAALALNVTVDRLAQPADTVMTVFTKGLGAPAGAVLAGPSSLIQAARQQRHYLGGGMKQGGVLAAACLVAIEQASGLADDHRRARELATRLAAIPGLGVEPESVVSNLILVDLRPLGIGHEAALAHLREHGVLALRSRPDILRLALHRDIGDADLALVAAAFQSLAVKATSSVSVQPVEVSPLK